MKRLRKDGISKPAIAKQLGVSRTSVIRLLRSKKRSLRAPGTGFLYAVRLIVLYCFQVSGSKQEEELSLVQFRSAGRPC